jgi:hypothetical protein
MSQLAAITGICAILGVLALDEEGWVMATPWIAFLIFGTLTIVT